MTAAFPHTVTTGHLTIDQVEGEACALCATKFRLGDAARVRPDGHVDGHQLYVHIVCPKGGATR